MYVVEIALNGHTDDVRVVHDPFDQDAVLHRGQLTQVLNAINDFQFEILATHPLFGVKIKPYSTRLRIMDQFGGVIFRGRVIDFSSRMSSDGQLLKGYVAECELSYLLDSIQPARELRQMTIEGFIKQMLRQHNSRTDESKRIEHVRIDHGQVTSVFAEPGIICPCTTDELHAFHVQYTNTFENLQSQLIEQFGGFIWLTYDALDRPVLNYAGEVGTMQEMSIELAKNLESMSAEYFPSREITRVVPLGKAFERYELAIDRLVDIGILNEHEATFWQQEVRHWRDGEPLADGQMGLSPWSGQLLLGVAKLNIENPCVCTAENDCQTAGCITRIGQIRSILGRFREQPDINSRRAYNEAIDFLSNSGAISSPDYWKEEKQRSVEKLRWLMRLAALSVITNSPRQTDLSSPNGALGVLGDSGLISDENREFFNNQGRPIPPEEDYELVGLTPELEVRPPEVCDVCDCLDHCQCDPICQDDPPIDDDGPPDFVTLAINDLSDIEEDLNVDVNEDLSPWMGRLLISLSRLNLRSRDVELLKENMQRGVATDTNHIDNLSRFDQSIDWLSNTGVIHSPEYWKRVGRPSANASEADILNRREFRWLIRLTERMVDQRNPIRITLNEAIRRLRAFRILTVSQRDFWLEQIAPPEAEDDDESTGQEPFSPWIGELLVELASLNYEDEQTINMYRNQLEIDEGMYPTVDDEGAFEEAIDSLSNAGAIDSPEYWKDPVREQNFFLRALIRLADLTVNIENPQANFPFPRVDIKEVNEGRNWLDVPGNGLDTVVEGIMVWDDINDPAALMDAAKEWVLTQNNIANTTGVSALDLSQLDGRHLDVFRVGDRYRVDNALLVAEDGVSYPLIEKRIDVVNPIKSNLVFGQRQVNMSDMH